MVTAAMFHVKRGSPGVARRVRSILGHIEDHLLCADDPSLSFGLRASPMPLLVQFLARWEVLGQTLPWLDAPR